jgi:hypothetical protein
MPRSLEQGSVEPIGYSDSKRLITRCLIRCLTGCWLCWMDDAATCSVCSRAVPRALACVDTQGGVREILCPVHFRQRHFQRVLEQRKLEKRWSSP